MVGKKQPRTNKTKTATPKTTTCGHVGTRMLPHTGACPGSASITSTYYCVPKHCTPAARVAQSNTVLHNAKSGSRTWSCSYMSSASTAASASGIFEMLRHNRHHDRTWSCRKPFRRISPADGNNALELDNLLKPLQLTVPLSRDEQFVQRRQLIEYVQMSLSAGAAASIR